MEFWRSTPLAKTEGQSNFTPLTMLQASAQAADFKVGRQFGERQGNVDGMTEQRLSKLKGTCFELAICRGLRS
jgi:hypothetical protein